MFEAAARQTNKHGQNRDLKPENDLRLTIRRILPDF
jgi:hypothetical protein